MVYLKTTEEIQCIGESAKILGHAHGEVAQMLKPVSKPGTWIEGRKEVIRDRGGMPSFLKYNGFPASLCISVNDGGTWFTGKTMVKDGYVSIDCGVFYKRFSTAMRPTHTRPEG